MSLLARLAAGERVEEPVAVVAAHPDDETIGLGSRLPLLARLTLVHLTDGAAPADAQRLGLAPAAYAAARARELDVALAALGAHPVRRRAYTLPDQRAHESLPALIGCLTADLAGQALVITHAYEHGHPDHDTAALATAAACARLHPAPLRAEFACYHLTPTGPAFGRFHPATAEHRIALTGPALDAKRAAIAAFTTQAETLAQLDPATERLRPAPAYDFARPAPPGAALYERWGFPLTAAQWRAACNLALTTPGQASARRPHKEPS